MDAKKGARRAHPLSPTIEEHKRFVSRVKLSGVPRIDLALGTGIVKRKCLYRIEKGRESRDCSATKTHPQNGDSEQPRRIDFQVLQRMADELGDGRILVQFVKGSLRMEIPENFLKNNDFRVIKGRTKAGRGGDAAQSAPSCAALPVLMADSLDLDWVNWIRSFEDVSLLFAEIYGPLSHQALSRARQALLASVSFSCITSTVSPTQANQLRAPAVVMHCCNRTTTSQDMSSVIHVMRHIPVFNEPSHSAVRAHRANCMLARRFRRGQVEGIARRQADSDWNARVHMHLPLVSPARAARTSGGQAPICWQASFSMLTHMLGGRNLNLHESCRPIATASLAKQKRGNLEAVDTLALNKEHAKNYTGGETACAISKLSRVQAMAIRQSPRKKNITATSTVSVEAAHFVSVDTAGRFHGGDGLLGGGETRGLERVGAARAHDAARGVEADAEEDEERGEPAELRGGSMRAGEAQEAGHTSLLGEWAVGGLAMTKVTLASAKREINVFSISNCAHATRRSGILPFSRYRRSRMWSSTSVDPDMMQDGAEEPRGCCSDLSALTS
ncbi:hypothetical protein GGX14DRAFT_394213 [Mycena pura]|uniref:Uncharacterized protein n=1 Tax=Mycena pura TaxID=153505 RepID=A0AAD6VIW9_9AGAR|nr:hypothetical protein GGX14DRAFT_394213 [Mycena pura]